ncbi:MAG: uracil-DNA glycosylase family protein [Treponema sp.]|jgi:hypothetical protein|nr:uracil-DNA glycosylase family protein [Treponema sp.]
MPISGFKLGTDLLKPEERIKKASGRLIPTLRGMIYVTYGLLNEKPFEEMSTHNIDSAMIEVLARIAWVNISKASGEQTSKPERIEKEDDFWKEILYKQIKTYSPDILIFGGTFVYFKNDWPEYFGGLPSDRKYFSQYQNDILVISTYHPSFLFHEDAKIDIKKLCK